MRVYATEERSGRRHLVRIECDGAGCEAFVKPHAEIQTSGWIKTGWDNGPGSDKVENDYCPEHA